LRRRTEALLALAILLAQALPAAAQRDAGATTGFVPAGHWSVGAARRLQTLGLAPRGFGPGDGTPLVGELGRAFAAAAERAGAERPDVAPLVQGWADRFAREFHRVGEQPEGIRLTHAAVFGGGLLEQGGLAPGTGFPDSAGMGPPLPRPEPGGVTGDVGAELGLGGFGAAAARLLAGPDDLDVVEAYAVLGAGPVGIWGGRRSVGLGSGMGGGVVLTAEPGLAAGPAPGGSFDGVGGFLREPVRLPGVLRHLGPIRFTTFVARLERSEPVLRPWFWAARGSIEPHERVTLGVNRGAMFGGEGTADVTLRNIAYMLIGKHGGGGSEFENHVVAVDLRVRPPLGRLPLAFSIEWGFEDSAGAWRDVPGVVAGAELGAVPGLPAVAVGVERTSFGESCCGNPAWYRHWLFREGWTHGGREFGHPLGGHGSEWLFWTRTDLAKLRLEGRLFRRDRGGENLYAPDRQGSSAGGRLGAEWAATPSLAAVVSVGGESGASGWRASGARAGLRWVR
jgi:hypothetical protein